MSITKSKEVMKSNNFKEYEINGYKILSPLVSKKGGNCKWGFASKFGKEFFIKEFLFPKLPDKDAEIFESDRKRMTDACNIWFETHSKVYNAVIKSNCGNIVVPLDFFRYENFFYLVTEKIDSNSIKFEEICKCTSEQRHVIMKILARELSMLAKNDIIHADLKPDNLMLKNTIPNFFTVKIIDFDASFLSSTPPDPEDVVGDQVYFSPEILIYITEEIGNITPKSDVFALGILFHQILCGQIPDFEKDLYDSIGQAVLNNGEVKLFNQIPAVYKKLILDMLECDADKRPDALQVYHRLCNIDHLSDKKITSYISDTSHVEIKKDKVILSTDDRSGSNPWKIASDL